MADSFINLDPVGTKALKRALYNLGTDRKWKAAMRRSLRKAALPVARVAETLAPKDTGRMAAKIRVTSSLSKKQRRQARRMGSRFDPNVANMFIGAAPRGPAVLMEFGTGPRRTKSGKYTGAVAARPFMRPAWEGGKRQVLASFKRELWLDLKRAAEREKRKQARALNKGLGR